MIARGRASKINERHWLGIDADGRPKPSRFGGGSYDALKHVPVSLRKPHSYYSRVLAILTFIRASEKPHRSAEEITDLFNIKYDEKKTLASISKILSRFHTWRFVDYIEKPADKRGGYWVLRADVDVNDAEALLRRAQEAANAQNAGKPQNREKADQPENSQNDIPQP